MSIKKMFRKKYNKFRRIYKKIYFNDIHSKIELKKKKH